MRLGVGALSALSALSASASWPEQTTQSAPSNSLAFSRAVICGVLRPAAWAVPMLVSRPTVGPIIAAKRAISPTSLMPASMSATSCSGRSASSESATPIWEL